MAEPVPVDTRIAEIQARVDAATLGPWYVVGPPWNEGAPWINAVDEDPHNGSFICDFVDLREENGPRESISSEEDADFIAHAREDVPFLLALLASRACAEPTEDTLAEALQRIVDLDGHPTVPPPDYGDFAIAIARNALAASRGKEPEQAETQPEIGSGEALSSEPDASTALAPEPVPATFLLTIPAPTGDEKLRLEGWRNGIVEYGQELWCIYNWLLSVQDGRTHGIYRLRDWLDRVNVPDNTGGAHWPMDIPAKESTAKRSLAAATTTEPQATPESPRSRGKEPEGQQREIGSGKPSVVKHGASTGASE